MENQKIKKVILASRPEQGPPEVSNFKITTKEPPTLSDNGIVTKTLFLSVDPYMASKFSGIDSYPLDASPSGGGVGQVTASSNPGFTIGDLVFSPNYPWAEMASFSKDQINKIKKLSGKYPPQYALDIFGMPGLTAYFGLSEVGKIKEGETVLISGVTGAVGSIAAQIAKIKGCKVIGITGSSPKCELMKKEFKIDDCLDYHTKNLANAIAEAAPNGIDCFFDNVGGPIFDSVIPNMNNHGRICLCGAISQYGGEFSTGPRWNIWMITKRLRMEGFVVFDYRNKFEEALNEMKQWFEEGNFAVKETIEDGIEKLPEALVKILSGGEKLGKEIVKVNFDFTNPPSK
jgi:NADPH-dependent curcumin reductase CurA